MKAKALVLVIFNHNHRLRQSLEIRNLSGLVVSYLIFNHFHCSPCSWAMF